MKDKPCALCRAGEHTNYGPVIGKYRVTDPEARRPTFVQIWLCMEHCGALEDDGYILKKIESSFVNTSRSHVHGD